VHVVHKLEPVEIRVENRGHLARAAGSKNGVVEPLKEQHSVGQPGQRVVQRPFPGLVGGVLRVGPGLSVEQIGRRDVSQRLSRVHGAGVQRPGGRAV
jgi:hypothetical protein